MSCNDDHQSQLNAAAQSAATAASASNGAEANGQAAVLGKVSSALGTGVATQGSPKSQKTSRLHQAAHLLLSGAPTSAEADDGASALQTMGASANSMLYKVMVEATCFVSVS